MHHDTLRFGRACFLSALFVFAVSAACSSTTTGSAACDNVAGTYVITAADCVPMPVLCEVSQNECTGTIVCGDMSSTNVEISKDEIRFSLDINGTNSPCVGAPTDEGVNGACTSSAGTTCDFKGRQVKVGQCGLSWTGGVVPGCDACADGFCCDELKACAPGSACSTLIDCIATNCPGTTPDLTCVMSLCSAEYTSGGMEAEALRTCMLDSCVGCD